MKPGFSIDVDFADPEEAASAYYERYEASVPEERIDYYGNDTEANEEIKLAFITGAKWMRQRTTEEVKAIFEWFAHIVQMASNATRKPTAAASTARPTRLGLKHGKE